MVADYFLLFILFLVAVPAYIVSAILHYFLVKRFIQDNDIGFFLSAWLTLVIFSLSQAFREASDYGFDVVISFLPQNLFQFLFPTLIMIGARHILKTILKRR
jgi:TRAP-type C4-dicarboxylate transport system permease small subunit